MTERSPEYEQISRELTKARRCLRGALEVVEGYNEARRVDQAADALPPELTERLEDTLAQVRGRLDELEEALAP